MAWVSAEQVMAMSGEVVTEANCALASSMIDTYAGVTEEMPADSITARDRGYLRKAAGWQAIWVRDKPGLLSHRESHTSTSADGVAVTRESKSDIMLAPMADRELRNLSWYSARTSYQAPAPRALPGHLNFLSEESDSTHGWDPV